MLLLSDDFISPAFTTAYPISMIAKSFAISSISNKLICIFCPFFSDVYCQYYSTSSTLCLTNFVNFPDHFCIIRETNVYKIRIVFFVFHRMSKVIIEILLTYTNHTATEHQHDQLPGFHFVNHLFSEIEKVMTTLITTLTICIF